LKPHFPIPTAEVPAALLGQSNNQRISEERPADEHRTCTSSHPHEARVEQRLRAVCHADVVPVKIRPMPALTPIGQGGGD
jgi:hypothetical protein